VQATEVVAGLGKGVVDSTIYLRVFTDALPDLTVLDLPGITCAGSSSRASASWADGAGCLLSIVDWRTVPGW